MADVHGFRGGLNQYVDEYRNIRFGVDATRLGAEYGMGQAQHDEIRWIFPARRRRRQQPQGRTGIRPAQQSPGRRRAGQAQWYPRGTGTIRRVEPHGGSGYIAIDTDQRGAARALDPRPNPEWVFVDVNDIQAGGLQLNARVRFELAFDEHYWDWKATRVKRID